MHEPTPYPARRRYLWARDGRQMSYTEAHKHFTNMRYQCPEDRNPQRWATLTLMLEALDLLQHEGHDTFEGHKLHKLFIKCAARCGWVTDLSQMQRKMRATPVEGDPTKLHCYACDRDLPRAMFRTPMTEAQRAKYNKPEGTRQYTVARRCADCRDNAKESKRRKRVRVDAQRKRRDYVRLTEQRKAKAGDTYRVYLLDLRYHLDNARRALSKPLCTGARRAFYEAKLGLALQCQGRLEDLVESNTVNDLDTTRVTWLNLLTQEEQAHLIALLKDYTTAPDRSGRSPVLETPLVTKREMPLIKTKKAKG